MKLSSKELTIIFIEFLVTIFLMILSSKMNFFFNDIKSPSVLSLILLVIVIIIVIALVFGIIYKRIGEIGKALEKQEIKQVGLEEKLKRYEQLIEVKADIKDLQRRIKMARRVELSDMILDIIKIIVIVLIGGIIIKVLWPLLSS